MGKDPLCACHHLTWAMPTTSYLNSKSKQPKEGDRICSLIFTEREVAEITIILSGKSNASNEELMLQIHELFQTMLPTDQRSAIIHGNQSSFFADLELPYVSALQI